MVHIQENIERNTVELDMLLICSGKSERKREGVSKLYGKYSAKLRNNDKAMN